MDVKRIVFTEIFTIPDAFKQIGLGKNLVRILQKKLQYPVFLGRQGKLGVLYKSGVFILVQQQLTAAQPPSGFAHNAARRRLLSIRASTSSRSKGLVT